ncbi:Transmembrane protein 41A [Gryganskiella cystojenkinii]|nr:Transmembrane protein 41A [Gryganskiella cystojenkinii]
MTTLITSSASTATVAALGRFHGGSSSSSNLTSSCSTATTTRQRSSSFTSQIAHANNAIKRSSSPATVSSRKFSITPETLNKGLYHDGNISLPMQQQQRDLSLISSSLSGNESSTITTTTSALGRAHERINLVPSSSSFLLSSDNLYSTSNMNNNNNDNTQGYLPPLSPVDLNSDDHQGQGNNTPTICTGRSRSNTLTNTSTEPAAVAAAAISAHSDHVMRPRRPSIISRSSGPIHLSVASMPSSTLLQVPSSRTSSHYPLEPLLPQHHEANRMMMMMNDSSSSSSTDTKVVSATSTDVSASPQLGFLPRILVLIGLFGMSLGGLYMLAQVLPPLSLPKSIDDVKVDAEILQEFATATFEGWLRTFWVFSAVYMWKQCFGIPGSAFLNILAGALYGPWFGTVLTSALTTLGSVLAYFMSFFLMEPIMNRYASSKLDQMRAQIERKTRRSSGKKSTALAMETVSSATTSTIATSVLTDHPGARTAAQRGVTLRTRSSSFTVRHTDETAAQGSFNGYYPVSTNNNEIEVQENEVLLSETDATLDIDAQAQEAARTEEEEEEDEEEGTSLFMQLLLIRLFPLTPYWFINLASPLVGVPVIPFMTSMFLGCMPYNYICAQAGAILGEIHELRDIYQQPWIMLQIVLVLILSFGGLWVSKRSKKQQLEREQLKKNRKSRTSEEAMAENAGDESSHSLLRSPALTPFEQEEREREEESSERLEMIEMSHAHVAVPTPKNKKRESAIIDMSAFSL